MATILNLETATTNCSVSVSREGQLLAIKEHDTPNYSHAEQLHVFIRAVVQEANITVDELDAIAVSKGPGSYTGLRIGVSAAKGLCFALDIPLISIPTLESMVHQVLNHKYDLIIPVLDARRMEVYSAVYDKSGKEIRRTRAEIIDAGSFQNFMEQGKVLLVGSGAEKCKDILRGQHVSYAPSIVPSSREMMVLSHHKFENSEFEDVAYFEPYYLKDFIPIKKKRA